MKILELLLSTMPRDKTLGTANPRIGILKNRINACVDKLYDPNISKSAQDFLKFKIQQDVETLKDCINEEVSEKLEVYSRKTGLRVGGPYSTRARARNVVDKKDNEYGGYIHGIRPYGSQSSGSLSEAVHKLPLSNDDFKVLKEIMENPIPASVAHIFINDVINDDELNDQINSIAESKPGEDIRFLIAEWVKRVMPDQLPRFRDENNTEIRQQGILSPIHGYDPAYYTGQNPSITGNAFGRFN